MKLFEEYGEREEKRKRREVCEEGEAGRARQEGCGGGRLLGELLACTVRGAVKRSIMPAGIQRDHMQRALRRLQPKRRQ